MKGFRSPMVESWPMHDSTHDVYTCCIMMSLCDHKCVALMLPKWKPISCRWCLAGNPDMYVCSHGKEMGRGGEGRSSFQAISSPTLCDLCGGQPSKCLHLHG